MKISIKHIGSIGGGPAQAIEMTVEDSSGIITSDITGLSGMVDVNFIINLRDIADELETQNKLLLQGER